MNIRVPYGMYEAPCIEGKSPAGHWGSSRSQPGPAGYGTDARYPGTSLPGSICTWKLLTASTQCSRPPKKLAHFLDISPFVASIPPAFRTSFQTSRTFVTTPRGTAMVLRIWRVSPHQRIAESVYDICVMCGGV